MQHKAITAVVIIFAFLATFSIVKSDEIPFVWEKTGNEIEFTALLDGSNYTWNFGDGSHGYGKVVSHTYGSDGIYNVILTVDGTSYNMSINTLNEPPQPDFFWIPQTPYSYQYVQFFDNSTASNGWIINWSWDFDSNGVIDAYGKNVLWQFKRPGRHDVTLRVMDNNGMRNGITKQVFVLNILPKPSFQWTKYNGSILFNASKSYDMDGYIVNYTWYFGDGSHGYGKVVSHTYAKSGVYTVELVVRDDFGETNFTQRRIDTTNKIPIVNFYWQPPNPTDLDRIYFYSTSNDSDGYIVNYTWYFGDGSIAYGANVSHIYAKNGIYNVTLLVIDNEMAYNYTTKRLVVSNIPPVANFSYSPHLPIPGRTIYFNSTSYDSDGYIVNYTWYFGDGSIAYGANVSHIYNQHGFYNVTLIVTDDDGATASKKARFIIADFYVNKSIYDPVNHIWKKVQDAVDNATEHAWVYVMDGKYIESITVDKSIYLLGKKAEISGGSYAFRFIADEIIIENFTIKNAENGIIIESNNTWIKNCHFERNDISLNLSGNYNLIEYNEIRGKTAIGIYGYGNTIRYNDVNGDTAILLKGSMNGVKNNNIGGGVGIEIEALNMVENNSIEGCEYGIKMTASSTIKNNIIENNTCAIFGAGAIGENIIRNNTCGINATSMLVEGAIFYGNKMDMKGGNFVVRNSSVEYGNISVDVLHLCCSSLANIEKMECGKMFIEKSGIEGGRRIEGGINASDSYFGNNEKMYLNGNITNCTFAMNSNVFFNVSRILNCNFTNNEYVMLGEKNIIRDCQFIRNTHALFINGNENSIKNNTFSENEYGIMIYNASKNSVCNNILHQNKNAIIISFSHGNILCKNNLSSNEYNMDIRGNEIWHFYNKINGTIDGRPILYLINESNILINTSYGFIGLIGCRNAELINQDIENNGKGIVIVGSSHINISNGKMGESINAIYVLKSNNVSIKNCDIENNSFGISFIYSYNNFVDCNIKNNEIGVKLFDIQKKDGRNVIRSQFHNNGIGIYIYMMDSNYIDGSVDSIKIDGSTGNVFNGSVNRIELKNCGITLQNATIDEIYSYASDINIQKSTIYFISADKTNIEFQDTRFLRNGSINGGNFTGYGGIFSAVFTLHNTTISVYSSEFYNGTLRINGGEGIVRDSVFHENGLAMVINASVKVENCTFYNNSIAIQAFDGVIVNGSIYNNTYGCISNGSVEIHHILFHHNSYSLLLNSIYSLVYECSFWENFYGIIAGGENNSIYHNNFVYNIKDAVEEGSNKWNLSYPYGGNYWDEYAGIDEKHGVNQNESGGDGIGDTPYAIGNSYDYYPLMSFYENASAIPNKPPIAAFKFYPPNPYSLEKIIFIDLSDDANGKMDIVSWHWDFGDGTASNEENPVHQYEKPGEYKITLTVKDRAGDTNKTSMTINITNRAPYANYSYSPTNASSYTLLYFISKSYDSDGYIVNYTWQFGDGSIAYGANVSHSYSKPGEYEVVLIVKDNLNETASMTKKIIIKNRKPNADFEFYPEEPKQGEKIIFKDLSTDMDGSIVSWHWDFGDGTASNEKNATHVYEKPGTYIIKLTVKDDNGEYSTYEKTVEIKGKSTPGMGIAVLIIALLAIMARRKFK